MKKILSELKSGICEIIYMDEHSVEVAINTTLSLNHMPNDEIPNETHTKNSITVFNVVSEEWQTIQTDSIINIERLTGQNIKSNERKLMPSKEYLMGLLEEV